MLLFRLPRMHSLACLFRRDMLSVPELMRRPPCSLWVIYRHCLAQAWRVGLHGLICPSGILWSQLSHRGPLSRFYYSGFRHQAEQTPSLSAVLRGYRAWGSGYTLCGSLSVKLVSNPEENSLEDEAKGWTQGPNRWTFQDCCERHVHFTEQQALPWVHKIWQLKQKPTLYFGLTLYLTTKFQGWDWVYTSW